MSDASKPKAVAVVVPIDLPIPIESAVVSFSRARGPAILESSMQTTGYGRFTILACDPIEVFTVGSSTTLCPLLALGGQLSRYPAIRRPRGAGTTRSNGSQKTQS